ncbi:hypothetical protein [Kamptonema formosum]
MPKGRTTRRTCEVSPPAHIKSSAIAHDDDPFVPILTGFFY